MTGALCSVHPRLHGFEGFVTIEALRTSATQIPDERGVYAVVSHQKARPRFLPRSVGGWHKGKDPTVTRETLESRWVDEEPLLYVGRASKSLRERIRVYLAFGRGKRAGHRGGRYIWQVAENESFMFCWRRTPDEKPSDVERQMLEEFSASHGKLPFANIKRGRRPDELVLPLTEPGAHGSSR
jgi:hypothetical protein